MNWNWNIYEKRTQKSDLPEAVVFFWDAENSEPYGFNFASELEAEEWLKKQDVEYKARISLPEWKWSEFTDSFELEDWVDGLEIIKPVPEKGELTVNELELINRWGINGRA